MFSKKRGCVLLGETGKSPGGIFALQKGARSASCCSGPRWCLHSCWRGFSRQDCQARSLLLSPVKPDPLSLGTRCLTSPCCAARWGSRRADGERPPQGTLGCWWQEVTAPRAVPRTQTDSPEHLRNCPRQQRQQKGGFPAAAVTRKARFSWGQRQMGAATDAETFQPRLRQAGDAERAEVSKPCALVREAQWEDEPHLAVFWNGVSHLRNRRARSPAVNAGDRTSAGSALGERNGTPDLLGKGEHGPCWGSQPWLRC